MNNSLTLRILCIPVFMLFLIVLFTTWAPAQTPARNRDKEAKIEEELRAIAPSEVEAFKAATTAWDQGNKPEAMKLFKEVSNKAPNFDAVNRRLGLMLVGAGETKEGMALLQAAVKSRRSPENLISLATALAYPSEKKMGTRAEKLQALLLFKEAENKNTDKNDADYSARVALLALDDEVQDLATFRDATRNLVRNNPNLMQTHYFNAIRAGIDEEWATAESEIKRAGELGLPADVVNEFLASGVHSHLMMIRYLTWSVGAVVAWAAGILLLFLFGTLLSKRTLKTLESADPFALIDGGQQRLRTIYRAVITIASVYYFISIPVVIFLLLAVAGGVVFISITRLISTMLIAIGFGALVTIFSLIRSLFIKRKDEDPGRSLGQEEAPGLWGLTKEVADAIGTRPVTEIRVTPGTEVAVYERGGLRSRMNDQAERVLIIGVGVLNGFKQNDFRAVLAHEYGHFQHRDTAGGDMALRVRMTMEQFALNIVRAKQNTIWNLGFHFLRIYHRIFAKISQGAGRLQEVLADRLSAYHYGPLAFEDGLRHVIRRKVEFGQLASAEINSALESKRTLSNLYELPEPDDQKQKKSIERAYEDEVTRLTGVYDSHPSPIDRFRLVNMVVSKSVEPASGMVWDLFADRQAIMVEMSKVVESRMKR